MAGATTQLYSTGPAYTFIAFGSARPQFFGTAKISPQIEVKRHFKPVFNDIGGDVAFDMAKMGKEAITALELTRWNDPLYETLSNDYSGIPGLENGFDTGSLILTEGLNFTFWVLFPFVAQKRAYKNLNPGYRFPGTYLLGPDKHQQMGTHPKELFLMFHHLNVYDPSKQTKLLFDFNMSAVLAIPPV